MKMVPLIFAAIITLAVPYWRNGGSPDWRASMGIGEFIWLLAGAYSVGYSDKLVRLLHDRYLDYWVSLGKPIGLLWAPKGVSWLKQLPTLRVHNQILLHRVGPPTPDRDFNSLRSKLTIAVFSSVVGGVCLAFGILSQTH